MQFRPVLVSNTSKHLKFIKNGNILDHLVCNNFGLDRIIFHSINFPLTNTCGYNLILFKIKIESQKVINTKN